MHATKPDLTNLDIVADGYPNNRLLGRSNWITVTKSPTPLISRWSDSLVCLTLNHPVDVPDFLLNAGKVTWPNLNAMNLSGLLDEPHTELSQSMAHMSKGSADLFRGLVAAFPSMPKMTTIRICLGPAKALQSGFTLSMDFGTWLRDWDNVTKPDFCSADLLNHGPLQPCSDSPVPVSASAVALVQEIATHEEIFELPGHLVSELQDTVRRYRQLKLAVFNCQKDYGWVPAWENLNPCTQWNSETGTWDPAFYNGMDLLIFQMGKYWEWKVSRDSGGWW